MMKTKKIIAIGWSVATIIGVWLFFFTRHKFVGYFLGFQLIEEFLNAGTAFGLYSEYPELIFVYIVLALVFVVLWIISLVQLKTTYLFEKLVLWDALIALAHYFIFSILNYDGWVDWVMVIGLVLKAGIVLLWYWGLKSRKIKSAEDRPAS